MSELSQLGSAVSESTAPAAQPDEGVAELLTALIQYDTTNYGDGKSEGERECAEFVATELSAAGYRPQLFEPADRRTNVVVRIAGADPTAEAILAHAHLDVVPAAAADWSVDPFSGEIKDGCVWGRGAIDMKSTAAMLLSVVRSWAGRGIVPERDVVLAFVADEEDDGEFGARYLAGRHAELFDGCAIGIGESGGWTFHVDGPDGPVRLYPIGAGERGSLHMELVAHGSAGHGSRPNADNPVTMLVEALHRIAQYRWPIRLTPVVTAYLERVGAALGIPVDAARLQRADSDDEIDELIERLGPAGELVRATVRNTCTPTMVNGGYKVNVIPSTASAQLDTRALPGTVDEMLQTVDDLLGPGVQRSQLRRSEPLISPIDTPWFDAMADALRAHDPEAVVVPYCLGGGTDAKPFAELGIAGYGFSPLAVPPDLRLRGLAHGVDERCPVDGLSFGAAVLDDFLRR